MDEIRRHTEAQTARCRNLMKKLKTIQLEELEEYGEQQLESVVKNISEIKEIDLTEAVVPEFLKRQKPLPLYDGNDEDDEQAVTDADTNLLSSSFDSKLGLENIRDVTQMMRTNIKETRMSSFMFGHDNDDTDSESDYEDEVEMRASSQYLRGAGREYQGYLPVELNPATKWARERHEVITRWMWLQDAVRNIDYRLKQQDELLRHINVTKPRFKFDQNTGNRKPTVVCASPDLKDATIQIFREDSDTSPMKQRSDATETGSINAASKAEGKSEGQGSTTVIGHISNMQYHKIKQERGARNDCYSKNDAGVVGGGLESLKLRILDSPDPTTVARRCMPVLPFRQRKMFQLGGIHNVMGKSVRKPTTMCNCFGRTELCAVCSGRSDKVKPVRNGAMTRNDISALLDHTYHKVLSTSEEKPLHRLIESALKTEEWTKPLSKKYQTFSGDDSSSDEESSGKSHSTKIVLLPTTSTRPKKILPSVSLIKRLQQYEAKITKEISSKKAARKRKRNNSDQDDIEEDDDVGLSWTPKRTQPSTLYAAQKRRMDEKYDIDHIVIPYSIAAATRVEKIEYKEIMIPSWRSNQVEPMVRTPLAQNSTRLTRHRRISSDDDMFEDTSLEAITSRHHRSEIDEKKRFLNAMNKMSNRRSRRSESKAENNSESGKSLSPLPDIVVDPTTSIRKLEEAPVVVNSNQISAADASLAVTALKISTSGTVRRRTISACKIEDDEIEECGYSPFEPRKFPLEESLYTEMVKEMETAYEDSEKFDIDSEVPFKIKQEVIDDDASDQESEVDDPDWKEVAKKV